jgi:molybdate transport system permease protein
MIRRATVVAGAVATLAFVTLPVAAIFARLSWSALAHELSSSVVTDAIVVSVRTTFAAQALVLVFGTPAAWLIATHRFRGRSLVITLVELPIVLPPAVAGIGLLAAFGRAGLLHTGLPFTQGAVVLAVAFVAGPLYVRQAIAAFEVVDPDLVAASRTLGAGPARTFFRVVLPTARSGLGAGAALSFARGLGEFGATIMFAGSFPGVTQTLPLAVYRQFDVDFHLALALGGLLVLVSVILLLGLKWLASSSTSAFRFATSTSS